MAERKKISTSVGGQREQIPIPHTPIEKAWKRADPAVLYSYLGLRGKRLNDPPGNIEFVYLVAERVRLIIGDPMWEEYYQRIAAEIKKSDNFFISI